MADVLASCIFNMHFQHANVYCDRDYFSIVVAPDAVRNCGSGSFDKGDDARLLNIRGFPHLID